MFGIDDQMHLLRAWNGLALDCMTTAAQVSTAMLGFGDCTASSGLSRSKSKAGRSWYRAPDRELSPMTWFGLRPSFPATAMMPFAIPASMPAIDPFQYWTHLLRPAPTPADWLNAWSLASWPMASSPWAANTGSAALGSANLPSSGASMPFATYRSDSGHAVAQLTFPNQVVAAVAVPATAMPLLDTFLAWSRMLH